MTPITEQELKFMAGLLDEFKIFVLDAMTEGHHDNFADHFEFLKACFETFQDSLENEK